MVLAAQEADTGDADKALKEVHALLKAMPTPIPKTARFIFAWLK